MADTKTGITGIIKKLSEPLNISDIDFRIQSISEKGYATILAYKDARVDMKRLDDVLGAENWQRDHKEIKNVVYCGIGVRINNNDKGEAPYWVWKWDAGSESNTEKQKGEASDSFKRAGFNYGIGRELYDFPYILLQLKGESHMTSEKEQTEFKQKQASNKTIGTSNYGLKLKKWVWTIESDEKGKLKRLTAKDQNGLLRYDSNKDFNGLPETKAKAAATKEPVKKENSPKKFKPKMTDTIYAQAVVSENKDSLTKALKKYDLLPAQLSGLTARLAELNK